MWHTWYMRNCHLTCPTIREKSTIIDVWPRFECAYIICVLQLPKNFLSRKEKLSFPWSERNWPPGHFNVNFNPILSNEYLLVNNMKVTISFLNSKIFILCGIFTVGANWLRTVGFLWSKMVEFRSLFWQILAKFWQIDYDRSKGYFVNFTSNSRSLLRSSQLFDKRRRKRER